MMMTRFEEITTQEALDAIVRAAMKNEYDKGGHVTNGQAFRDAVIRRELDNNTVVPGSLKMAYNAAQKTLASEATRVNPEAYTAWTPPEDDYQPCTPEERARWLTIIQTKLARLDLGMNRPTLVTLAPLDEKPELDEDEHAFFEALQRPVLLAAFADEPDEDDDIPGYGDAA